MHAPWAVPGLGTHCGMLSRYRRLCRRQRARLWAHLCLLPGSSCGLLSSETSA